MDLMLPMLLIVLLHMHNIGALAARTHHLIFWHSCRRIVVSVICSPDKIDAFSILQITNRSRYKRRGHSGDTTAMRVESQTGCFLHCGKNLDLSTEIL